MSSAPPPRRRLTAPRSTAIAETAQQDNRTRERVAHSEQSRVRTSPPTDIPQAHVTVGLSATRNLGDFNSLKVTVQLTRPCADTPEAIEQTYQEASYWVEQKLNAELAEEGR